VAKNLDCMQIKINCMKFVLDSWGVDLAWRAKFLLTFYFRQYI
jgi:hypothetical protein